MFCKLLFVWVYDLGAEYLSPKKVNLLNDGRIIQAKLKGYLLSP